MASFRRADAQARRISGEPSSEAAASDGDAVGEENGDGELAAAKVLVEFKGPSDDGDITENDGTDADAEGDGREGLESGGNADVIRVCRAAAAAIAAAAASAASTDAAPSQPRVKRYLKAKSFQSQRMKRKFQRFGGRNRKREKMLRYTV